MTPRTGSELLCSALELTGVCGRPQELFRQYGTSEYLRRYRVKNYSRWLERIYKMGSSTNGVFGVKVGMYEPFFGELVTTVGKTLPPGRRPPTRHGVMERVFPGLRYIWITRRNKVRQAVSWWKAIQTGVWHVSGRGGSKATRKPTYSFLSVDRLYQECVMREAGWQEYFSEAGIIPLTVVYEDFVASYKETVAAVLEHVGVTDVNGLNFRKRKWKKQADAISEEWVQRYRAERQAHWDIKGW